MDFFLGRTFVRPFLFTKKAIEMHLRLIKNPDESKKIVYDIARVIYAETNAKSLPVVEALASMIKNISVAYKNSFNEIISNENIFTSLKRDSKNHSLLKVDSCNRGFQMCLRVVKRMMNDELVDTCYGATKFHRADEMPAWAVARGYIADVDGFLFYL